MILIDNTVFSNFALTDTMELLKTYCNGQGAVTRHVLKEFEQGVEQGLFGDMERDWLTIYDFESPSEIALFTTLSKRLGSGEASCLAVSILRAYDLLSDDMLARKIAQREGVRLSGSIGVLVELIQSELMTLAQGNRVLKAFIRDGYFSPVDTLDTFI